MVARSRQKCFTVLPTSVFLCVTYNFFLPIKINAEKKCNRGTTRERRNYGTSQSCQHYFFLYITEKILAPRYKFYLWVGSQAIAGTKVLYDYRLYISNNICEFGGGCIYGCHQNISLRVLNTQHYFSIPVNVFENCYLNKELRGTLK